MSWFSGIIVIADYCVSGYKEVALSTFIQLFCSQYIISTVTDLEFKTNNIEDFCGRL